MEKKLVAFFSQSLIAFLISKGIKVEKVDKHRQTNRAMFFVEDTDELKALVQKWRDDQQFHDYYKAIKDTKKLMGNLYGNKPELDN